MSFASDTKSELSRLIPKKKCCMLAEIAGIIRICGSVSLIGFGKMEIIIPTDNPTIARHIHMLLREYYEIKTTTQMESGSGIQKKNRYIIRIGADQMAEQILRETGILMVKEGRNYFSDGIYDGVIRTKCCRKSYLRGLFLGAGTMSHPKKGYQFEIVCNSEMLANDVKKLINSFVDLHAKVVERKGEYVAYLKEASQILDTLAIMGAHTQYFAFEDIRLTREMRNEANRRANCDQANIDRTIDAAEKQLKAIQKIKENIGLEALTPKLREMAVMRMENPYISLTELGQLFDPPLKKSGVNKRLQKLIEYADKFQYN